MAHESEGSEPDAEDQPGGSPTAAGLRDDEMRITVEQAGGVPVIKLEGELDMLHESALRQALLEVERGRPDRVVVDLRGLSFIDSTGLRLFLEADARARAGGWLFVLVKGARELPKVFRLTLLDRRLTFVEDPSEVD